MESVCPILSTEMPKIKELDPFSLSPASRVEKRSSWIYHLSSSPPALHIDANLFVSFTAGAGVKMSETWMHRLPTREPLS